MTISEEQLEEKRRRNAEAQAELRRIEAERVDREQGLAREQSASHLDVEYERIQAAIARAKALSEAGTEPAARAEAVTEAAAAAAPVKPAAKAAEPKSTGADAEPGEGK